MTTPRKLDRQPQPGHDDDASDDARGDRLIWHASEPARSTPATHLDSDSVIISSAPLSSSGLAETSGDVVPEAAARPPAEVIDGHTTEYDPSRDDTVLKPGGNAERASQSAAQATSPNKALKPARPATPAEDQAGSEARGGVDARRRGWFWHWNNVVTQYAPLIGLKGVGLLNSYTVWTDRRDESPHRGYAFPSQQSEADFYGEERAELITINKILVALDLIEIRKEMLTRVDERGRRWRVPHNLYRVKDRPDGLDLRAMDVLRVTELAQRDATVFRYVRRVFSERFRPIDGDNVWHAILNELRHDPTWRELQERTRVIEARASARTRAGHQSRTSASATKSQATQDAATATTPTPDASVDASQSNEGLLLHTQQPPTNMLSQITSVELSNTGSHPSPEIVVERVNHASAIAVAESNTGSSAFSPTTVADSSTGGQPVVGPGNTTYDQTDLTTTTTTTSRSEKTRAIDPAGKTRGGIEHPWTTTEACDPSASTVAGPFSNGQPSGNRHAASAPSWSNVEPADALPASQEEQEPASEENQSEMLSGTNEGANNKRGRRMVSGAAATNQQLEARTERDGDEQRAAGTRMGNRARERRLADPTGGGPLVDPGPLVISTFEDANNRRITPLERDLLAELERDADPAARAAGSVGADWVVAAMREAVASGSAFVAPKRIREIIARWSTAPRHAPPTPPLIQPACDNPSPVPTATAEVTDVRLPGGASGSAIWTAVLDDLARTLDREAFDRLLAGSRITRYWRGSVEICVGSSAAADKLSNEYRGLVERHLNSRLQRPIAVRFAADPAEPAASDPTPEPTAPPVSDTPQPLVIAESDVEIGRQVWQSLLVDLARSVPAADLDRLAGVVVLGQDASGAILLGTPSPLACRLLAGHYRAEVESSLAALLGQPAPVRVLDAAGWSITPRA